MNKLSILFFLCAFSLSAKAQHSNAEAVALKISIKCKDSLSLTQAQADSIYRINMWLHEQKIQARKVYTQTDSLQFHIQRIESMRNGLYKPVLGEDKYLLYRQKKVSLISTN